jgi:hypothetical protein
MSEIEPADAAHYYSFTAGATFEGPYTDSRVGAGQYAALNQMPNASYPQLTFGLTQSAKVNNQSAKGRPLNAVNVLPNRLAIFEPITTVYVWLESNLVSSTVITQILSNYTVVKYQGQTTTRDLVYDPDSGIFVPKKPSAKVSTNVAVSTSDADTILVRPLVW